MLWPHRSLGPCGTGLVLGAASLGLALGLMGAPATVFWPLAIPAALTIAALGLAFWLNNRAARFHELIEIGPELVRVSRAGPAAAAATVSFNRYWVRVCVTSDRYVENRITLTESGRCFSVGEFLTPEERADLAKALEQSLRRRT